MMTPHADLENNVLPSIQAALPPVDPPTLPLTKSQDLSNGSVDSLKKGRSTSSPYDGTTQDILLSKEDDDGRGGTKTSFRRPGRIGTVAFPALALVILAWWIASIVLPYSRHRWIVQSFWAWFFVLVIAFRFVPATIVSRPVSAIWKPAVARPVLAIPSRARLALAWLAAFGITFGCAFGMPRPEGTSITDRVISLIGVFFFQGVIFAHSHNRGSINWIRIPISILLQQALALFVLKSSAGYDFFLWFHTAVADFLGLSLKATALIFDPDTVGKGWFFSAVLGVIIFLAAWVQMIYFFNWFQWLIKNFAWFGQQVFAASGAETFVAIWTPFFGQIQSAILIGPYIESMTDSELFSIMAVSMSSISSLTIFTYVTKMAIPARNLITQAAIVMPSAIVNAKVAFPEPDAEKPVTRSRESTYAARKKLNMRKAHDVLDSFTDGAWVGLKIAGSVLVNFFTVLCLLLFVDGFLVWVFRGFSVHHLDLHQVAAWLLYPLNFFTGIPRDELWDLTYILSGKVLVGSDFAFAALAKTMSGPTPFSPRGFNVISVALANSANLTSLGIQVAVMSALAPSRKSTVAKLSIPALLIALFTALQSAAVFGTIS